MNTSILQSLTIDGPVPVDAWMSLSNHTYYSQQNSVGRSKRSDFITAPETSQMFGELIGAWIIAAAQNLRIHHPAIVEAGPGNASLLLDVMRVLKTLRPQLLPSRNNPPLLLESSPRLRLIQSRRLPLARHILDLSQLPPKPVILIANEFLDALPVQQFVRVQSSWRRRLVALNSQQQPFFLASTSPDPVADAMLPNAPHGSIAEMRPAAENFVALLSQHINSYGGLALFIDYGRRQPIGDSLRGVKNHRPVPPLLVNGDADLSCHVDFSRLALAAQNNGAEPHGPVPQGAFLLSLGLAQRARALSKNADADARSALRNAFTRLAHPNQMGQTFKAFALSRKNSPALPAFPT